MSARPRPFTPTQRTQLATDLRLLADELERDDAHRIQQGLAAALDDSFPSHTTGGAPGAPTGTTGGLTVVEAKAGHTDPVAGESARLLGRLHRIADDTRQAWIGLAGWRTDRPIALCPEGHVMDRASSRCLWVDPDTGRRCGTRKETILHCENPYHVTPDGDPVKLLPTERRYTSVALDLPGQPEVKECARCRSYRRRNGRSWADATRLNVPALGAYSSDHDPWDETG